MYKIASKLAAKPPQKTTKTLLGRPFTNDVFINDVDDADEINNGLQNTPAQKPQHW